MSKILLFQCVMKIKLLMRFLCAKSLKFSVSFALIAHLSSDWPQFRGSAAACG